MNDRYPDEFDDAVSGTSSMADVHDLDHLLDALGTGAPVDSADPLIALFAAARSELDEADLATPGTPPDVSDLVADTATPTSSSMRGRHRVHRRLGFTRRAATAGGISVTGILITGGVAAAIAVGGFSVAAYNGVIPGIPAKGSLFGDRGASDTSVSSSSTDRNPRSSGAAGSSGVGPGRGAGAESGARDTGVPGAPVVSTGPDAGEPSELPAENAPSAAVTLPATDDGSSGGGEDTGSPLLPGTSEPADPGAVAPEVPAPDEPGPSTTAPVTPSDTTGHDGGEGTAE